MSELQKIQEWLGELIAQPLQNHHLIAELSPFGTSIAEEAQKFIAPSPTLQAYERVQIYHQQYWWRLLKTLQTTFPALVRLFGYEAFQSKIAVPYLGAHPPSHWALCQLGDTLCEWLSKFYNESDKYLVCQTAEIDWACTQASFIKTQESIQFDALSTTESIQKTLSLQPYVFLFALQGDFFTFRDELLKNDPEFYYVNDFPKMTYGNFYFVLYRTSKNMIKWNRVSEAEHWALSRFREGCSIESLSSQLELGCKKRLEEAMSNMPLWFKQWTILKWF